MSDIVERLSELLALSRDERAIRLPEVEWAMLEAHDDITALHAKLEQAEKEEDPALAGISYVIKESGGAWEPCSGCYDTEDGHPTQGYAFSKALQTGVGCGCHECGGLGAVWWYMSDDDVEDFNRISEIVDAEYAIEKQISRLEYENRTLLKRAEAAEKALADARNVAFEEAARIVECAPLRHGNAEIAAAIRAKVTP